MKNIKKWLLGLAIFPLGFFVASDHTSASQVPLEWYFGNWDCNIDGRPAQMQWYVVDDPQTICSGNICSTTSGVRTVGRFSDNGSPWVPLERQWSTSSQLGIRYLGNEQDNWYLSYNSGTQVADGWTTWRGNQYPLQCRRT
jgi:hypothetical protein